jgi:hypothetical protein
MIKASVPTALATVALAALTLGTSSSAGSAEGPCAATGPSKGTPHATPVTATASPPKTVDQRTTPQATPGKPARATPHPMPQPSLRRAKKLKAASRSCVPHSAPNAGAPRQP